MSDLVDEIIDTVADSQEAVLVVNEVLVRSLLFALLRGKAPKYELVKTHVLGGTRYSFRISSMGRPQSFSDMRRGYALKVLRDYKLRDSDGFLETLSRYSFAICAFLPKNAQPLMRAMRPELSSICQEILNLRGILLKGHNMNYLLDWEKAREMFSGQFKQAAISVYEEEDLIHLAYALLSSAACKKVTDQMGDLKNVVYSTQSFLEDAPGLAKNLIFLSNFNPKLREHYTINFDGPSSTSIECELDAIAAVLSDYESWPHLMRFRENEEIKNSAVVDADMLVALSMLLDMDLKIVSQNIEGIFFEEGVSTYSFAESFSFPMLREMSWGSVRDGIAESPAGRRLIDLMISSHHSREQCNFPVCYYSRVRERIKDLCVLMEGEKAQKCMLSSLYSALYNEAPIGHDIQLKLEGLISMLRSRLEFLKEFTHHEEYNLLASFLAHSSTTSTHVNFRDFLASKMGTDEKKRRPYTSSYCRIGTVFSYLVGSLLIVGGCIAIACHLYLAARGNYDFLIGGIVLMVLGVALITIGKVTSYTKPRDSQPTIQTETKESATVIPEEARKLAGILTPGKYSIPLSMRKDDLNVMGYCPNLNKRPVPVPGGSIPQAAHPGNFPPPHASISSPETLSVAAPYENAAPRPGTPQ